MCLFTMCRWCGELVSKGADSELFWSPYSAGFCFNLAGKCVFYSICGGLVLVLRVSVGLSCSGLVYTDGGLLSSESWLGGVLSNVFGVRSESVMVGWLSFWAGCLLWCVLSSCGVYSGFRCFSLVLVFEVMHVSMWSWCFFVGEDCFEFG